MIKLQFVRQRGLSSSTIAWFSAGYFSHVDAVMPDGSLLGARSDRIGPWPPGVQIRSAGYVAWPVQVVMTIPASNVQERKYRDFLMAQVGKPYDKLAILGFLFDRNWRDQDAWICSELQAAALEYAGVCPPLYLAANKITPVALALVGSALNGVTQ